MTGNIFILPKQQWCDTHHLPLGLLVHAGGMQLQRLLCTLDIERVGRLQIISLQYLGGKQKQ